MIFVQCDSTGSTLFREKGVTRKGMMSEVISGASSIGCNCGYLLCFASGR